MADTTEQLRNQQRLTEAIQRNLSSINDALGNQLRIQQMVNQATQGQAIDAARVSQISDDALRTAGVNTATYTSTTTAGLAGTSAALDGHTASAGAALTAAGSTAQRVAQTYDDTLSLIAKKARGPLRDAYNDLQEQFGGLMGPGGIAAPGQEMVRSFKETNLAVRKEIYATSSEYQVMGLPLKASIGDISQVMANFNHMIVGKQGTINAFRMMKDATDKTAVEMALFGKGMGLDAERTSTFVQRQISLTGRAGTDMLAEAAATSKAMEKATGISSKLIASSIEGIIADTENFGNVTVKEAGRMSAALMQLGVTYEDLGGMVAKFQAFDQAASSVSALTTVFGVQLDAMEMMQLANEDQETFLRRMREGFLQAGRSADTMTLAQKRLVKEQLGLKDVESVERLLDPRAAISSMEELTAATAAQPDAVREIMGQIEGDILSLQDVTAYGTEQMRTFVEEGARQPWIEVAIAAEQAGAKMKGALMGTVGTGTAAAIQQLGEAFQNIAGVDPNALQTVERTLASSATQVQSIMSTLSSGGFSEAMTQLSTSIGNLNFGQIMSDGINEAATNIEARFAQMATNIVQTLKDNGLIPNSPEDILTSTLQRVGFTATHTGEVWEQAYAKAGISTRDLNEQLKDTNSVYSELGKELGYLGFQYDDLSKAQKDEIAQRLQLGDDAEDQIRAIMGGKAATQGRLQKTREDFATNLIEYYKASGADITDFSEEFLSDMERRHGINRDMFAEALSAEGDISEIVKDASDEVAQGDVSGSSESSNERLVRSAGRVLPLAEQRQQNEATVQIAHLTRGNTAQLGEILSTSKDSFTALEAVVAAVEQLSYQIPYEQQIIINLDGAKITDAVIRQPGGTGTVEGTVVIET